MRKHFNIRGGSCLIIGRAVISLGWNIWGFDLGPKRYCIIHLWRPALLFKWESN